MQPLDSDPDADCDPASGLTAGRRSQRRIDWALIAFDGYVGINNHMGSRFTADAGGMLPCCSPSCVGAA